MRAIKVLKGFQSQSVPCPPRVANAIHEKNGVVLRGWVVHGVGDRFDSSRHQQERVEIDLVLVRNGKKKQRNEYCYADKGFEAAQDVTSNVANLFRWNAALE
jgi:hypothetical protein